MEVFLVVGGLPISTSEFAVIILALALAPLAIYMAAYEYSLWRKKRVVRATVVERK